MHLLAFAESIQLFPDGTIFIHIAMILGMIWILNRTLYRPINRVLEAREKNKGGRSGEAAVILKDVDDKESRYNREMLDTRSKGYEMIESEAHAAATAREKQIGDAKTEVAEKFAAGKADLDGQTSAARATLGIEAEKIADSIAANILKS